MNNNVTNFHVEYMDVVKHWHTLQGYAGGDHLLTALHAGWSLSPEVEEEIHWCAGMRAVSVYRFKLVQDDEEFVMPVVTNPYVNRFIKNEDLTIVRRDAELA